MHFAHPIWLVLLVTLPLLGLAAVLAGRFRRKSWGAFVAPRLRRMLLKHTSTLPRWIALVLLLAACAALVIAQARPQGALGTRNEKSLGRNLLIALDLSRSMRTRDVKPDRLAQAKMVISELLDAMPHERIGVIGFAGSSYLYAPLTVDHAAVRETIEQIDESWAPMGGSDLASAVKLATATLKKTGQKNNALVILSDGENHEGDLDAMIEDAQRSGVYILAIGLGTADGDYIPNPELPGNRSVDRAGKPIISRLQSDVLRKLADQTHGHYAHAGSGVDLPAMVKSSLKTLDAFEMEGRQRNVFIEFYQWLVFPAILFLIGSLIASTRWRGLLATTTLASVLLAPMNARADDVSNAQQALRQKRTAEARDAYHKLAESTTLQGRKARFSLGEATAAYQEKDFTSARAAFSRALLHDDGAIESACLLGLGNTLFQLGWQNLTDASYPEELNRLPNPERFDALVRERLAKLPKPAAPVASATYPGMESLITNWTDAVSHFDSASAASSAQSQALHNRALTQFYLKRLVDLLDENRKTNEPPPPGQEKPEKRDGTGKEKPEDRDGDGKGPKPPGTPGQGQNNPKPPADPNQPPPDDPGGPKNDEPNPPKGRNDPNESPEHQARRILMENADLEKGPLTPGRQEFHPPEKDW